MTHKRKAPGRRKLLQVVLIVVPIMVLACLAWGRSWGQQREKARRINCRSCLKNLTYASSMYTGDHGNYFPSKLRCLIEEDCMTTLKVYVCPSTKTKPALNLEQFLTGKHCDYLYFGRGLTGNCNGFDPDKTILGCDKPGNHKGYYTVWFASTRVKGYLGDDIEEVADQNGLFLPEYNMPAKAETEEATSTE